MAGTPVVNATVQKIIDAALNKIGVLANGETAEADDAQVCLDALNMMVDSWNTESLMIYTYTMSEFSLVAGQRVYTIGPGGNFDVDRPIVQPIAAKLRLNLQQIQDLPLAILEYDEYAAIVLKQTQSSIVGAMHMDGGNPLRNIFIWPVPSDNNQKLLLWLGSLLSQVTSVSSEIVVPAGHNRALVYNLAVEVAPNFGRDIMPAVAKVAIDSKANLKRINYISPILQMPAGLVADTGRYNIYTDNVS